MTLVGSLCVLVLILTGRRPKKWCNSFYIEVGKAWGGVNLGMFFLCCKNSGTDLKNHEYGHAVQNCILGPLMPFLVSIPSGIRYWYREIKKPNTAYDSIWFERWATEIGDREDG